MYYLGLLIFPMCHTNYKFFWMMLCLPFDVMAFCAVYVGRVFCESYHESLW